MFQNFFPLPEEQRDAPDTRQRDKGKNDTADCRSLATKGPAHYVELEQADAAPVDRADDHKDQSDSVQHVFQLLNLLSVKTDALLRIGSIPQLEEDYTGGDRKSLPPLFSGRPKGVCQMLF